MSSTDQEGKSCLWPAVVIFLLALTVRFFYLYDSFDNPSFNTPIVDAAAYDEMARSLVQGRTLTERLFWQPIFYPLFLQEQI